VVRFLVLWLLPPYQLYSY